MAMAAPIIMGASQVMEGISANAQAGAQSDQIGIQTKNQVTSTKSELRKAMGAQQASAGASGIDMASGSFQDVFEESAINRAKTLADIRYAGKMQQAQVEQEGKNALISGVIGGIATGVGGVMAAKQQKQMMDMAGGKSQGTYMSVRQRRELGLLAPTRPAIDHRGAF